MARQAHRDADDGEARLASRIDAISARLRERGLKHSSVRQAVLDAFLRAKTHLTIDELTRRVREVAPTAAYSTVYRTMKFLVDEGFASARDFGGDRTLYEPAGSGHHDHLICTACGEVQEFEDAEIERLQERVAKRHGFEMEAHRLELYGTCRQCQRRKVP
jgi:Fur family ferric uptake transcriptional regulator